MTNANHVRIELSANAARLKRDMASAQSFVESSASVMSGALGALGVSFGAVQAARFMKGIIDDADAMSKLAQKTNMAVEQVAGWSHALDLASVSQEALQKTAKALGTNMLDAARGVADAKQNFAALDIDIKNNDGSLKSVNAVLLEVADRYARSTDKTAAAALMNKVLGKSALDLIPAFQDGRAALEAMIEEGQRLNPFTEESTRQAAQFNDNISRLSKTIKSEFISAMNSGLPAMAEISENLVRSTKEGRTFWGVMNEGAKLYLATVGTLFPFLEGITQEGFNALAAKSGTILRPGEVAGKIGGLPATRVKPFTPNTSGTDGAAAAAKKALAERKKLLEIHNKGEIDALIENEKRIRGEWEATNNYRNGLLDEDTQAREMQRQGDIAAQIERVKRWRGEQEAILEFRNSNKTAADEMTEFWRSAAQNMQSSMGEFFFDAMQGNLSDLAGSFKKTVDRMAANALAAKAATALFGADFGKDTNAPIGGLIGKVLGSFATGTSYVPKTGPYLLHEGEKVVPAAANSSGNLTLSQTFVISGPIDRRSQTQIAAAAFVGAQRATARNT